MATNKYLIGSLILVVLASSYYIMLPEEVKLLVSETSSTFYVWEDKWVVSGIETNKLYNGTKLVYATNRKVTNTIQDNMTNITRTANFGKSQIIDTYIFDGNENDKELFPIEETHKIINGTGLIYQYQVTKLIYNEGNKEVKDLNEYNFGKNMKIEWEGKPYYAKITQQINGLGTLTLKWKVNSNNEIYNIRLFDPWFNISWSYVRPITITNTSVLSDYQVNILLNSTYIPNLNWSNNGSDIRLFYDNGTANITLSYWIESWNNFTLPNNASIWFRTNVSNNFMAYGNPTATSQSNGTNVFDIFDDFDDGIFDTANWIAQSAERPQGTGTITESNGLINISCGVSGRNYGIMSKKEIQSNYSVVVFKVSTRSATTPTMTWTFGYSNSSTAGNFSGIFFDNYYAASPGFGVRFLKLVNGSYVSTDASRLVLFDDTSAKLSVTRNGSYIRLDNYSSTINYTISTSLNNFSNNYFFLGGRPNSAALGWQTYDWIYGRKLMSPEPTLSIGAEETYSSEEIPNILVTPNPFTNNTHHGQNNYVGNITITAGIDLHNVVMNSIGGDLPTGCSGCTLIFTPTSLGTILAGNNQKVNVTLIVPFGQTPLNYWTNLRANTDEGYNGTVLNVTVIINRSINISNSSLGIFQITYPTTSGQLKNITIHNTGNIKIYNISNNITSIDDTSLISYSNSVFDLNVLGTQNIQINYTLPSNVTNGLYNYTIYFINSSMIPQNRYVSFALNLTNYGGNITLYLNGTNADRFYELGNPINITACANVTGTTVYINTTHPSLTNPISNGTTCATYLWNNSNVVMNQFNDSATSQNHSANNISGITINSVTDLQYGEMYLKGYNVSGTYPYNLSFDIGNDGLIDYWLPYMNLTDVYAIANKFKTNIATKNLTFSRGGTNVTYIQAPCNSQANALSWNVSGGNGTQNLNKVDGLSSKSLIFSTENSSNTFNLYLPKSSTVATAPVNITLTGSPYYSSAGTLSGGNTNPDVQPYSGYKQTASTPYDGSSIYLYGATYAGGSCTTTSLTLSLVGTSGTKAYCTSLSSYICGQYYYYSCTVSVTGLQPAENVWVTVSDEAGNPPAKSLSGDWAATYFSNLNQYAFNNATNITIWQNGTNLNYQYLPELNSSVTLNVNLSSTNMNSYLTTCTQDPCPIPYTMKTTKRGNVTISGVNVDYTNSISNITYDVANDGTIDASISGNNIPNNNITIGTNGLNAMNYYIQGHCINNSVSVPIVATSQTAGTMALSNLIGNFSINPISLNISAFNLSGTGNIQVPIKYNADNWGILNTYGLSINALTDYNYTFTGWSDSLHNATQTVKLIWSNFSMKFPQTWIDYTEFVPKSITSKNVTPTGQTDSNPIYNFSYLAREQPMNISIWLNESINSCVNITASTTSNKTDGRFINTTSSNQIVSFNSSSGTVGIHMWADLQCTYPIARWLNPVWMISSKCSECA